jgi:hypothetical protein
LSFDKCIVRGRAYEDILVGDSVYVIANKEEPPDKAIGFKVQKITTYRKEVPVLNGMVTGDLSLSGNNVDIIKDINFMYKILL